MTMKKNLCVLLLGLCLVSISACGNKGTSGNSDNIPAASHNEKATTEAEQNKPEKEKINIEDLAWNIEEGIVDGDRYVLLDYTNNTPYTIAGFELVFKEKSGITEKEKATFYSDIQKMSEASDEEMEELKEYPLSIHTKAERVVDSGESVTNVKCYYYSGYRYLKDMNHYNLFEPDIATIKYVDEDKIYTVYYDYGSKKYSAESGTEVAYQWSQTDLGSKIPRPDVKIVYSSTDREDAFKFDAYGISPEQFNVYVEECKNLGYTVAPSAFEGYYSADDTEGYSIRLDYDEDDFTMSGRIEAPDEKPEEVLDKEEENDKDISEETENENAENKDTENGDTGEEDDGTDEELVDGMRPEFKEAMDSYEAFYDEYCDIVKKYMENPSDTQLLASYTSMLAKAAEASKKFEAWEDGEMNDAELKYYLEVSSRVAQKLLDAAE